MKPMQKYQTSAISSWEINDEVPVVIDFYLQCLFEKDLLHYKGSVQITNSNGFFQFLYFFDP